MEKILITTIFITVQKRNNTRNREPAKLMIHIMEYKAIVKSCGELFTDTGRRWFTTEASKKQCVHCDISFLVLETKLKKKLE